MARTVLEILESMDTYLAAVAKDGAGGPGTHTGGSRIGQGRFDIGETIKNVLPPQLKETFQSLDKVAKTSAMAVTGESSAAVALANPVGLAVAGLTAMAAALPLAAVAIKSWAEGLLDSQRAAARFSGSLQAVFANYQMREFRRENEFGESTAGTTGDLAASLSSLQDALLPIRIWLTNFENGIASQLLDGVTGLVDITTEILGVQRKSVEVDAEPNWALREANEIQKRRNAQNRRPFQRGPF